MDENYGLPVKNVPYTQKHTRNWYVLISNSIRIGRKWTRNLRLYGRYLERWGIDFYLLAFA